MTSFLYSQKIRIFDYPAFASKIRDDITANTQRIAQEQGVTLNLSVKSKHFAKKTASKQSLNSAESIRAWYIFFQPWNPAPVTSLGMTKKPAKPLLNTTAANACTIISILSMPSLACVICGCRPGAPSASVLLQWPQLAGTQTHQTPHPLCLQENAFLAIETFKRPKTSRDRIGLTTCIKPLICSPADIVHPSPPMRLSYHWSIMQVEYATDIVFKKQADLRCLYEPLIRIAIHSVKPENIATFLGQKLHLNYQGEIGNNFNTRILGTRIKHQMGAVSIKMYDKFGIMLAHRNHGQRCLAI